MHVPAPKRVGAVTLVLGAAVLTGVLIPYVPIVVLIHILVGAGLVAPVIVFLHRHWWLRHHYIHQHGNARTGAFALMCLLLLFVSGLALLQWTNLPPLRWMHWSVTLVLLLNLGGHIVLRRWRRVAQRRTAHRGSQTQPGTTVSRRRLLHWPIIFCLIGIAPLGIIASGYSVAPPEPAEARPLAHASLRVQTIASAQNCAICHGDVSTQWQQSAHAQAATDAYYQALAAMFIEERGIVAVRYCATCHNPIGLMKGEIDPDAAQRESAQGQSAYEARALGVAIPLSSAAAEGVTCGVCHQAINVTDRPTNGSFHIALDAPPPDDLVGQLSLRAAPEAHRAVMLRAVVAQAQLCGSCHNLHLPDNGMALEPTYDEWLNSSYPSRGATCQNCHLPAIPGRNVDSNLPQRVRAHGGIPGSPGSLPGLASDTTLLRKAAELDAALNWSGSGLIATVTITNSGAGHYLPTGADDLRQVWLEATLSDSTGRRVWQSGVIDQYGTLPSGTVQFHKVLGDANGQPIDLHRFWIATQILSDTRLAPQETRRIRYPIALPSHAHAPYRLTIRLLYRDVSQQFAEFALARAVPELPVREMARMEVVTP